MIPKADTIQPHMLFLAGMARFAFPEATTPLGWPSVFQLQRLERKGALSLRGRAPHTEMPRSAPEVCHNAEKHISVKERVRGLPPSMHSDKPLFQTAVRLAPIRIRIGIVWVQRDHSTGTCTATLCEIETRTHQKFESFKKKFAATKFESESAN